MLTAKEALELTNENRDLKRALEMIKEEALKGKSHLYLPLHLKLNETKLRELGYETIGTSFGLYCSWSNPNE
jgi:hypothetical protein